MRFFYAILAGLGLILPYSQFIPWLLANGVDIPLLVSEASSTSISAFAWLDVLVSAVVLLGFILVDSRREQVKHIGLPIIGTLLVGVSFGLPLYLFMREAAVGR
ncbi:MAG: DUF2834 domain-containing protein [Chloroflexota bacterium]